MPRRLFPMSLVLLLAAGCARTTAPPPVSGPAARIVSLAPSVTEVLFALGAGPRVVACTSTCDYPPQVRTLPRIGSLTLDYDRIVALRPDLVVAEAITPADAVERLQHLGLRVARVQSRTLQAYRETLDTLGRLTGTQAQAGRLARELDDAVAAARARPTSPPRVFVEVGDRPLFTVAQGSFIDEMVRLVGGANIFGDLAAEYPKVDPEAVVARDPQVVILTASDVAAFESRPAFATISAVRTHHVFRIDPDLLVRPSPRLRQGLAILARCVQTP